MTNSNNKPAQFANIGIVGQASWRYFIPDLARHLIERYGSKLHLYCVSELHAESYRKNDKEKLFSTINVIKSEVPQELPVVSDEAAVFARATALENKYRRSINSLIVTHRHLGRGYALGGYYHPKSFLSEESSYVQVVELTTQMIEYWEAEFTAKKLTLMINLRSDVGNTVARHHNVPVRNIYESRYKSYNNWAVDDKLTNPLIKSAFDIISSADTAVLDKGVVGPPTGHVVARSKMLNQFGFLGMLKASYKITREQLYNIYKGNSAGSYYLISKLAMRLRARRDAKRLTDGSYPWLKDLGDRPFIFFPLHVEPEASLQGQSPEYLSQLNAIVSLSRSLPAKYVLVVKEHLGAVGRRPEDFYGQIKALKNVVMLDLRELGKDVVEKSSLVATISGTAGLEAAIIGLPVITFGRHNSYNILPHVKVITDETQIKECFDAFLSDDYDRDAYQVEGVRYLKAVENASFNLEKYNHLTGLGYSQDEVIESLTMLEKSLTDIDQAMIDNALSRDIY
jgi:hypothetical protein